MSARSKISLLVLLTVSATASLAQTSFTSLSIPSTSATRHPAIANERHLQATEPGFLYANSAFAHGFRHGYDEGFSLGDLNLQIGREPSGFPLVKESRQAPRDYREIFGSKQFFQQGYQAGFNSGYSDAVVGLAYRVHERIEKAAAGLATDILPPNRRAHFDEGFAGGYASAQTRNAPSHGITVEYVEQYCRKNASGPYALEYCSGFSRGYLLGMSNPPSAPSESASSSNKPEEISK